MIVHTIIFGTYTCRYAQAVPEALVVLEKGGYIIAFVNLIHDGGIVADMFISHSGSDLCATVPFLVELVVEIIIVVLVRFRLDVVSGRIHYVGQPGNEITGNLSVLYAAHQVTWQSVVHHP